MADWIGEGDAVLGKFPLDIIGKFLKIDVFPVHFVDIDKDWDAMFLQVLEILDGAYLYAFGGIDDKHGTLDEP